MTAELDLSSCEREPIHIPGAIQSHGVLLALDNKMIVRRMAGDLQKFLGLDGDPLGRPLDDLVDLPEDVFLSAGGQAEYVRTIDVPGGELDLFVHRSQDELIVELEPAPERRLSGAEVLSGMLPIVSKIASAPDVLEASVAAAEGVRGITGYDRVMIYRFLDDDSGQVIAEARSGDVDALLNHRYPATDIPRQARALYLRNPTRVIHDVGYSPVPIIGGDRPLDLSGAVLRSVSPVHIQYLKNMEVGASASFSLVRGDRLWGLIACHHRSALPIPHEEREMCRRVAIALDQTASRLEEDNAQREVLQLTRRREELMPLIAVADSVGEGLRAHADQVRRLVSGDGVAILLEGDIITGGKVPTEADIRGLGKWLLEGNRDPLATDGLSQIYEPAAVFAPVASGLISCIVSRNPLIGVLWFRAEEVETVNWAGNPHKPAEPGRASGQLNPRKSFETWAETVRGRSRPWRENEQDAVRRISSGLAEIGREKTLVELNRQLSSEIAEKDLLMREMHHRVQNSLQLVTSMLQLQEREVDDETRSQLELARDRILSVALLHRRLWQSEDLKQLNLQTFFSELVEGLMRTWSDDWRDQLVLDVQPIRFPAHEALLLALVVSELLTNAVKHAYGGAAGPLSLTARTQGDDAVSITVADRGVGTDGTGRAGSFGSRLVQRLVGNMRGEIQVTRTDPGSSITLLVPMTGAH